MMRKITRMCFENCINTSNTKNTRKEMVAENYPEPTSHPTINTRMPPTTTWKTAESNGVSI